MCEWVCVLNGDYLNWIINLFVCVSQASGSSCLELSRWVYTTNSTKIKLWIVDCIQYPHYIASQVPPHAMPSMHTAIKLLHCRWVVESRCQRSRQRIKEFGTIEWTPSTHTRKGLGKYGKSYSEFWMGFHGFSRQWNEMKCVNVHGLSAYAERTRVWFQRFGKRFRTQKCGMNDDSAYNVWAEADVETENWRKQNMIMSSLQSSREIRSKRTKISINLKIINNHLSVKRERSLARLTAFFDLYIFL